MEDLVRELEATGDYRVLRRLKPRTEFGPVADAPLKLGLILDTETTGLDTARDHVIELGMVAFEFSAEGHVCRVVDTFSGFRDPGMPIPPDITTLTGITQEMVDGQQIDPSRVASFVDPAVIVIAHKAAFDRPLAERHWPCFTPKAWACSLDEVDWRAEGFEGSGLAYLLMGCGLFHDGHRAAEDCAALLEVLSRPLPRSGDTALKRLLDTARRPTLRLWATNSPFEKKDMLKARGYRWSDGTEPGKPKAWFRDLREEDADAEMAWLDAEIYGRKTTLTTTRITAMHRHSLRG